MDALFHKGIELAELDKHEKAIKIFDEILAKHKDNVNVIYAKSRSFAAMGDYVTSLKLLRQSVSKNPKVIREWAKKEKIFEKLHGNDEFRKLVKLKE